MITADQLLAHGVGDYLLQSHWMAMEKTSRHKPALLHALTYTLPFLFLTRIPKALVVISGTHFLIDRYRLARYVTWFKNVTLGLPDDDGQYVPEQPTATGYPETTPSYLSVWLLIIADNLLHVILNGLILRYLSPPRPLPSSDTPSLC